MSWTAMAAGAKTGGVLNEDKGFYSKNVLTLSMGQLSFFFFFSFRSFCLFRAAPAVHGGSHARELIRAVATGLHHSDSNARSEVHV